jgi:hypothetical protein
MADLLRSVAQRQPPDLSIPRHGFAGPVAVIYRHLAGRPVAFIEFGFTPKGDVPEPLSTDLWDGLLQRFALPQLGSQDLDYPFIRDHRIEFGPFTILLEPDRMGLLLPTPDPSWEASVRRAGSCLIVMGIGLRRAADGRIGVPSDAAGFIAAYGGALSAPPLDQLPGLHLLPLTGGRFDPLGFYSFVLDTDVLIEIERFCLAPNRPRQRTELVRHLLMNLAYRDLLPGIALAQVFQRGRRSSDLPSAIRAAKAIHEVMGWDRNRIASHSAPCHTFRSGFVTEFSGTESAAQMLFLYAGVLRLRVLWSPGATLADQVASFRAFVEWLRDELQVASATLFQIAANLFVSSPEAHRQASRLLHFSASAPTEATLNRLWGTAFDLLILTIYGDVSLEPTIMEPVLLTFDAGLAAMFDFLRHVSFEPITPGAGPGTLVGSLVATRLDLNPRLVHLQREIDERRQELQAAALDRASRGQRLEARADEIGALVDHEEGLLLRLT